MPWLSYWCVTPLAKVIRDPNVWVQVWYFVPSTNQAAALEDMSYIFGRKLRRHAQGQGKRIWSQKAKEPRVKTKLGARGSRMGSSLKRCHRPKNCKLQDRMEGEISLTSLNLHCHRKIKFWEHRK